MRFFIDAGHNCSADSGAIGILSEDAVVKETGKALEEILTNRGHRCGVSEPSAARTVNESLKMRYTQSNRFEPDLFVSIHANAFQSTDKPMGTEVFAGSEKGMTIARQISASFARRGFIDRGAKDGGHLSVIKNTNAVAILVELGFVDSLADTSYMTALGGRGMALLIADVIAPVNAAREADKATGKTIGDLISEAGGSTAPLAKLNLALAAIASEIGSGLKLLPPETIHYRSNDGAVVMALQPEITASFYQIAAQFFGETKKKLIINSCYRTAAQQVVLYEWAQRGLCGISLAAYPGTSNHEGGEAIDVEDWQTAKAIFKRCGWVSQQDKTGTDPVHFERNCNKPNQTVLALQKYYNRHNPNNQLVADGGYGDKTRKAVLTIPITGY